MGLITCRVAGEEQLRQRVQQDRSHGRVQQEPDAQPGQPLVAVAADVKEQRAEDGGEQRVQHRQAEVPRLAGEQRLGLRDRRDLDPGHLESGRIVASETEAPNMLVNLV